MNRQSLSPGRAFEGGVDVILAKLGVLGSLVLLGLQLFASQAFLLVIPLSIGTGSALYLLTDRPQRSRSLRPTLPQYVAGFLPSAVILGMAALVVMTHSFGLRTDAVYLLTGVIGAAIFGQILFFDDETIATGPMLFQILAAAVAIRFTALYVTPGYVGVDIWTHATVLTDGIVREGSLSPLAESKYLMAPIYHVIGAVGALVFGSVRNGIYLSLGILVPLSALFVYATGSVILPARWALLATALYAFADQFIRWSMHVIPTSLGLVFFLAMVYFVTRLFSADAERWTVGLLLVCSLAVVFTHQVSTAIALLFLGIATFVAVLLRAVGTEETQKSAGTRKALSLAGVFVVTLITTIASWANTPFSSGSTFLWREIAVIGEAVTENAGFLNLASTGGDGAAGAAGTQSILGQLVPYIELFGFALLLAAAIVGGLVLLRWNAAPGLALTHVLTAGGMFVVVFGLSIFGVRALLPGRWMAFLYLPLVILGAAGVYYVSQTGSRRLILAAFLLLAVGYPTTMVVAEKATLDNPAFEDQFKRFAYTESEIAAVHTIGEMRPPADETIATDHPYTTLFDRLGGYDTSVLVLGHDGPTETETAVYRDYQSEGPVAFPAPEGTHPRSDTGDVSDAVCPATWNKVYANDDVWLCTAPAATPGGGA